MKALNSFRSWAAAGFAAVVLCFAQSIMAQNTYIITGSGTQFTATIDGSVVGDADQTLAIVRDIIKLHAAGDDCVIQFGDGTETLNIGPANIMFDGGDNGTDWGLITLTGKMTSSFTNTTSAVIVTRNGVSVNSMADIANTAATNGHCIIHNSTETLTVNDGTVSTTSGRAIENISTGSVNIIGGTVSATNGVAIRNQSHGSVIIIGGTVSTTSGRAVENQSAGLITVSGGTVLATTSGRAVENQSTGSVNINGGTVSTTSDRTVVNQYTGSVNISGGTVLATTARAIENLSTGKITISGDALVTSANTSSNAGTIVLANSGTATAARLEITGGTITNTADNGNAVYNASTGSIDLGGSPAITGIITKSLTAGNLRVITEGQNTFVPDGKIYKLDFNAATQNNTATVVNGKNFAENFESVNSNFGLEINNNDIVVKYKSAGYTYQKSGTTYVVTHVLANAMVNGPIQTLIDLIKADAAGNLCVIQFGDGMETLDIGAESIEFDDGGTSDWGEVTITGRLTSSNSTSSTGVIFLRNGISLTSTADITNTANSGAGIRNNSAGALNIRGGTVSVRSGYAIYNNSSGGTVTVSGGTVSATTGDAIYNRYGGGTVTVTISGGTVSATTGTAIYHANDGSSVTVSGGTVSATTGDAIIIGGNCIATVSGNALITSANTNSSGGTIIVRGDGARLNLEGGTVRNTSNNSGSSVIYFNGNSVNVSGGTVSATTGVAINHTNSYNSVTISGGTVSATTGRAVLLGLGKIIVSGNALVTSAGGTTISIPNYANASTGERVSIEGGTVENTSPEGNAIYNINNGSVSVSGGKVLAKNGYAISGGIKNLTGGLLFAYGTGVDNVISGSYRITSGDAVITAWDQAAGNTGYTPLDTTDIFVWPSTATAVWDNHDDISGIAYGNGTNTGFLALDVTVSDGLVNAAPPVISAQPKSGAVKVDDMYELTVTASAKDGGTLGYQWYSSESAGNAGGTAITGETNAAFTVPTDAIGTYHYYVVVTNSIEDNGDGGQKTASVKSSAATVSVSAIVNVAMPVIITQSANTTEAIGTVLGLFVIATSPDNGTLKYQWYSSESASSTGGTAITGGTNATFIAPTDATGTYYYYVVVTNSIEDNGDGGQKAASVTSDVITVTVDKSTAILSPDRIIPDSDINPDKAAQVNALAGDRVYQGESQFTAGPNPVTKSLGMVNFYRQGKRISNCEMRIYDASGNFVKKVKISDKPIASLPDNQARRSVGSWDLKDSKGRAVSEGTYLIKGAVTTSDGKKERISVMFGLR